MYFSKKTIKLIFAIAIFSLVFAFAIAIIALWLNMILNFKIAPAMCFNKSFIIAFCLILFFMIFKTSKTLSLYNKLDDIRKLEGFSPRYFEELNHQISIEKRITIKTSKMLILSEGYEKIRD